MSLARPYLPASTPRTADVILYLDLDGVVQHEQVLWHPRRGIYMDPVRAQGRTLFEWLPHLEAAIAPYPDLAIVLSSTWCVRPGYAKTLRRLPEALRSRFIGGTFHRRVHGADPWVLQSFRESPRGMQVWSDVLRRKPRQWLALDDDTLQWPVWARKNLVACDGATGLSSPAVQQALAHRLQECYSALARGESERFS